MTGKQIVGLVLIALGVLALIYGGFSYTEESHDVELGPLEFQVQEKERVQVPVWLGVGVLVIGVILVAAGRRGAG